MQKEGNFTPLELSAQAPSVRRACAGPRRQRAHSPGALRTPSRLFDEAAEVRPRRSPLHPQEVRVLDGRDVSLAKLASDMAVMYFISLPLSLARKRVISFLRFRSTCSAANPVLSIRHKSR